MSLPLAADDGVVAVAAEQHVVAVAAGDGVVACAAVHGQLDDAGREAGGGDRVVAAERVHDELIVASLPSPSTATIAGRPATVKLVPLPVIWTCRRGRCR